MAGEDISRSITADIEDSSSREEISKWRRNLRLWQETLREHWGLLTDELSVRLSMVTVAFFVLVGIFAPYIAPYEPLTRQYQTEIGRAHV